MRCSVYELHDNCLMATFPGQPG